MCTKCYLVNAESLNSLPFLQFVVDVLIFIGGNHTTFIKCRTVYDCVLHEVQIVNAPCMGHLILVMLQCFCRLCQRIIISAHKLLSIGRQLLDRYCYFLA